MRGVAWIALASSLGGLMIGLLLGTGLSCRVPERAGEPELPGVIPGAGVIVIRTEASLDAPAEFGGDMPDPESYRHEYRFRDAAAARRAGEAARAALRAEMAKALRGE